MAKLPSSSSARSSEVSGEKTPKDHYNDVVEVAQLQSVRLKSIEFYVKPDFFDQNVKHHLSYVVEGDDDIYQSERGIALAFLTINVVAKQRNRKLLSCKADYVVAYDGLKDCDETAVQAFLRRVAPFTCYPYFRSLFATLDWSAGTRLPPLPIHKEGPSRQARSEEKR